MAIFLILLIILCIICSGIEDNLCKRDRLFLYVGIGILMILIAGLREVGSTPDTEAYEDMFNGKYEAILEAVTEPSFTFIAYILHTLSLGITSLFFVYALLSVSIHLSAFWKISEYPLMTLTVYCSFYYMMHDLVQIRGGVAAAFFVWAIYFYQRNYKWKSFVMILLGTLFHYSAASGLIIFALGNKLRYWEKIIMYGIIPVGLVAYFINLDISYLIPDSIGGAKLEAYRQLKEYGLDEDQAGYPLKYHVVIWMNIILYLVSLSFSDYLSKKAKYFVVSLKLQAIGFSCLFFLNGVSAVLATRLNGFFSTASIFLWTSFIYLFTPLYVGKLINSIINLFRFTVSALFFALSWYFK